jgi:hypothetical protein
VGGEGSMTRTLFSGFTIAPTLAITSGVPYTATLTGNTPNTLRVSTGLLGAGGSNRLASIERNAFHLPKTANVDLRVSRGFSLAGSHKLEAILDVFNVFNRLNHTQVNTLEYTIGGSVAAPTLTYNPTFGTLTNANSNYFVFTPRQVQLALRYSF